MGKIYRKVVVRLYSDHDMDLILLSHSSIVNFSKMARQAVVSYLANTTTNCPLPVPLDETIKAPAAIKSRQFTVYFDADEDAEAIHQLDAVNSANAFIKYAIRRYLYANMTAETGEFLNKAFTIPIGARDEVVPVQRQRTVPKKKTVCEPIVPKEPTTTIITENTPKEKTPAPRNEEAIPNTTTTKNSASTDDEEEFVPSVGNTEEFDDLLMSAMNSLGGFKA